MYKKALVDFLDLLLPIAGLSHMATIYLESGNHIGLIIYICLYLYSSIIYIFNDQKYDKQIFVILYGLIAFSVVTAMNEIFHYYTSINSRSGYDGFLYSVILLHLIVIIFIYKIFTQEYLKNFHKISYILVCIGISVYSYIY